MFNWRMLLLMVMPMLEAVGTSKVNEDENDTGSDDIIGQAILFGVKIFRAVLSGNTGQLQQMLPKHALVSPTTNDFNPPKETAGG